MKYRDPKKDNDLFSMLDHQQEVMRTVKGINKRNAVIDWELFRTNLESLLGYDARDARKGGRPPFDSALMLKVLVLQRYHGLSDDETEFRFLDRFSFMQFLSLLKKNCQNFIQFKAKRGHSLSEEGHATNKLRSRIRVLCEQVFGRMKTAMDKLRTIGLVRAQQHNALSHLVYNMDRTALLRR
jgi:hypothetical protein